MKKEDNDKDKIDFTLPKDVVFDLMRGYTFELHWDDDEQLIVITQGYHIPNKSGHIPD